MELMGDLKPPKEDPRTPHSDLLLPLLTQSYSGNSAYSWSIKSENLPATTTLVSPPSIPVLAAGARGGASPAAAEFEANGKTFVARVLAKHDRRARGAGKRVETRERTSDRSSRFQRGPDKIDKGPGALARRRDAPPMS